MPWKPSLYVLVSHSLQFPHLCVPQAQKKMAGLFTRIKEAKGPVTFLNALRIFGISSWAETESITEIYSSFDDQGLRDSTHCE